MSKTVVILIRISEPITTNFVVVEGSKARETIKRFRAFSNLVAVLGWNLANRGYGGVDYDPAR